MLTLKVSFKLIFHFNNTAAQRVFNCVAKRPYVHIQNHVNSSLLLPKDGQTDIHNTIRHLYTYVTLDFPVISQEQKGTALNLLKIHPTN